MRWTLTMVLKAGAILCGGVAVVIGGVWLLNSPVMVWLKAVTFGLWMLSVVVLVLLVASIQTVRGVHWLVRWVPWHWRVRRWSHGTESERMIARVLRSLRRGDQ